MPAAFCSPRPLLRSFSSLLVATLLPVTLAGAQQAVPWTVSQIFGPDAATGAPPPRDAAWSPDGTRYTYLSDEEGLVSIDSATGEHTVLVPAAGLAPSSRREVDEKDSDHRGRYSQPPYQWAPDGKQLLFDLDGTLWIGSPGGKTLQQVGDSGQGSGDDPKFSPDSRAISYIHNHNLYVVTPGQQPAAVTHTSDPALLNGEVDWVYLEELKVHTNYAWSPDSAYLVYLQMNETAVPQYPIEDWIPAHATLDMQRYPQPGDRNPAVRVGVAAVTGGDTRWIDLPIRAGDDYVPRLGWVDAHTVWIETLARDHGHRSILFADIATGATKQVYAETDPRFLTDSYDVHFYAPGRFLLTSWRDGHMHMYRYSYDPKHPLAGEAKLDRELEGGGYEVSDILTIDPEAGVVFYASNELPGGGVDAREQQVWAVGLDGGNKHAVTTAPGWHRASFAEGHGSYSDLASTASTPPTLSLCRAAGVCRRIWQAPADQAHATNAAIPLEFKAADGTTILYATLTLPRGAGAAGSAGPGVSGGVASDVCGGLPASVPLINNPYGGPGASTIANRWAGPGHSFDALLAEHGFAVLHVDNRGMAGRGRDFEQAAYRDLGKVQLADQLAAIDQVLAKYPQLDGKRLGWWGWSWGGTFTLNALTHSTRFLAGVAVAPVTDMRNYDSIYTERYLGLPAENAAVYDAAAVLPAAARLHGRLLIAHGTGDDNVHIENTIQFVQKLIDANLPYDLQVFPRKTHSIAGPEARTQLYSRILWQFETFLKPEPAAR